MVFINEWFPNPNGVDTKGEFIELFNNGAVPVSLDGWTIKTTSKKIFSLSGRTIASNGYLILSHAETKLSLKNNGETVSLYDNAGRLVDQSSYIGAAPSGESFSRVYYPSSDGSDNNSIGNFSAAAPQSFAWSTPTPGAPNNVDLHNAVSVNNYPFGVALNARASLAGVSGVAAFLAMLIGLSAILAVLVVYSLKSNENLSKLFFPRDGGVR